MAVLATTDVRWSNQDKPLRLFPPRVGPFPPVLENPPPKPLELKFIMESTDLDLEVRGWLCIGAYRLAAMSMAEAAICNLQSTRNAATRMDFRCHLSQPWSACPHQRECLASMRSSAC
jgi:hypothetical protein